jgi:6-phosphogluconolactonase (cycloisomerase 2 family)
MLIDSTGRFGLMVQSKTAGVSVYRMPTIWGPLTQVGKKSLSVGKQPIAITMHPGGEFFYVLDAGNNSIHQLHLDAANGKLTIARDAVSVRAEPRSLSIDPSGRFAYLRYTANEGLTRYEIDQATGQLTNPDEVLEGSMPSAVVISAELR